MKKLLQLLLVVTILPTVSMATVSCDMPFTNKNKDKNKDKPTKRIKNTELKLEVQDLLKDKTFNNAQEASEYIVEYKEWKSEGIASVTSSIYTSIDAASIAITPILKEDYAWVDTYGNMFEAFIAVVLNNDIDQKIESLKNNKYNDSKSAKNDIIKEMKKIKGISSVEFEWTNELNLQYSLTLTYKQNYSGYTLVSGETKTYTNLSDSILNVKNNLQEVGYNSISEAKNIIISSYRKIEGIKEVTFEWENSAQYKYIVNFIFQSTYYSDVKTVSDQLVKNESVKESVEKIQKNVENKKYDIFDANFEEDLTKPFKNTGYFKTVKFNWTSKANNEYTITFEYKKGFFGPKSLSSKALVKININDFIKNAITKIEFENKDVIYENVSKVEEIYSNKLHEIQGVKSLEFSTNVNKDNTYKLTIKVVYDDENYCGNKSFESNFVMKIPLDEEILKEQSTFEQQEFKSLDDAKIYVKNTITKVEGIKEVIDIIADNETKKIKFTIVSDELHSIQNSSIEWTTDLMYSEIKKIDNQGLSWVSNKLTADVQLSGYKLIGKNLIIQTDIADMISVQEYENNNNKYLKIKSLTNVAGVKTVNVTVQVKDQPESQVSFEVKVIGQPKITTPKPGQVAIKYDKNEPKFVDIDFHIDFYDDTTNLLLTDTQDDFIKTEIIKVNPALGEYKLRIYGLKQNKIIGSQDAYIKWNGQTLWTVNTKVK